MCQRIGKPLTADRVGATVESCQHQPLYPCVFLSASFAHENLDVARFNKKVCTDHLAGEVDQPLRHVEPHLDIGIIEYGGPRRHNLGTASRSSTRIRVQQDQLQSFRGSPANDGIGMLREAGEDRHAAC